MKQYNNSNIPLAKALRKNMPPWERKLWYEFLRYYPIRFQSQKVIGNYIADFYCAKARLVVELDGRSKTVGFVGCDSALSVCDSSVKLADCPTLCVDTALLYSADSLLHPHNRTAAPSAKADILKMLFIKSLPLRFQRELHLKLMY